MLARAHRMRDGEDFRRTIRRGRKGVQDHLVAHVRPLDEPTDPTSVGFVVSKAVGNSVHRNRVKRKLRHLMREQTELTPYGDAIVIRVLPRASELNSDSLRRELTSALAKARARRG